MSLVVVGGIAVDRIEVRGGGCDQVLGGSATYAGLAGALFTSTRMVSVVGNDTARDALATLRRPNLVLDDVATRPGATLAWHAMYERDLNTRHTVSLDPGVTAGFEPELSAAARSATTIFIGSADPRTQLRVAGQCGQTGLIAVDTIDLWIDKQAGTLRDVMTLADLVFLSDAEARQLTGESGYVRAGRQLARAGSKIVIVKLGEYGSVAFEDGSVVSVPAFPLERTVDPTGAGDAFAGGFLGYLASQQVTAPGRLDLWRAMLSGAATASFAAEALGVTRLASATAEEVAARVEFLAEMTSGGQ